MLTHERILFIVIILIISTLLGCASNNNIIVLQNGEKLDSSSHKINDLSTNWKKSLESISYSYTTSPESKIIALIFKKGDEWFYKEFTITNGSKISFDSSEGEVAYISLPANRTVSYSWSMFENSDVSKSEGKTYSEWMRIPYNNENEIEGQNFDRQVFDLTGNVKYPILKFQYSHINEDRSEIFECTIHFQ